jgi:hypothetical protein
MFYFPAIATEQSRENAAFGLLTTPDEAEVTLSEEGFIAVTFQAEWNPSAADGARAAIFIDGVQCQVIINHVNQAQEAGARFTEPGKWASLFSAEFGLDCYTPTGGFSPAAKGQIVGTLERPGGQLLIPATAAAHKVSVQFKTIAGSVAVKNRHLVLTAV